MKEIINELIDKKQQLKEEIERKGVDMSTATFSDYGDKIREIGEGSLYVTPLAQLGYSKEDEEFYKDLDFGTLGEMIEDFEYSRGKMRQSVAANLFKGDTTLRYAPYLDFENATNIYGLFNSCSNLKTVPTYKVKNATSIFGTFYYCSSLEYINVSEWDVSKVTNMESFVNGCSNLKRIDVSRWNTEKATNMNGAFARCGKLEELDVSNFDMSNITGFYQMFLGDSLLKHIDVSRWDVSKTINMMGVFQSCSSLTSLDVSNWNTSKVTNMQNMFNGCSKLESLDVSKWDVGKVTNLASIFDNCKSLKTIDVSNWIIKGINSTGYMFRNSGVEYLDCSGFDLTNVTFLDQMCNNCANLDVFKLKNLGVNESVNIGWMVNGCTSLGSSPEGLEALRNTLIRDSFDRASAGYSAVTISLPAQVKARLTTDEIAQITAKGFTIT
jgi:surface protein